LFETRATDPLLLVTAAALLGAAAFAAGVGPARRAARIDPLATLRQE
jgi:ABC-type antimicrobial peptide transport system permease subunit